MKLADLEPVWMGERKRPAQGIAFNCPGDCCAEKRVKQEKANEAERAGAADARDLRVEAVNDQPFRVWVAFSEAMFPGANGRKAPSTTAAELYTRDGSSVEDMSIAEDIDRREAGHVLMRLAGGEVTVL